MWGRMGESWYTRRAGVAGEWEDVMETNRRDVTIHVPDKVYSGYIDVPNETLRTIDIFNSTSGYWKDPSEKGFDDALLLNSATVTLDSDTPLLELDRIQIRLADILFFFDDELGCGDSSEKIRAEALSARNGEKISKVYIITHMQGDSFFYISGLSHGRFRSKTKHRYIPLTNPTITEVHRAGQGWKQKNIPVQGAFVGVNTAHIEACTFSGVGKH